MQGSDFSLARSQYDAPMRKEKAMEWIWTNKDLLFACFALAIIVAVYAVARLVRKRYFPRVPPASATAIKKADA